MRSGVTYRCVCMRACADIINAATGILHIITGLRSMACA